MRKRERVKEPSRQGSFDDKFPFGQRRKNCHYIFTTPCCFVNCACSAAADSL